MRINISKVSCCGCSSCSTTCPKSAITMIPNVMGFLYPVIDENKCVDCGVCVNTCQFKEDYNRYGNYDIPVIYGARHKNDEELNKSQSGALSWAIIETFLQKKGVVYGASFETVYRVKHSKATSLEEALKFRTSKYIQSDVRGVFTDVKKSLQDGNRVLFFGTGCQIAGLKASIHPKYHDLLFTVDIICHAVPSPAVWESFVKYKEEKYGAKVVDASFRDKRFGWHSHIETMKLGNNGVSLIESTSFTKLFYDHIIIRPSCTNCHFTNYRRVGDLTIGDFWGWEKNYKEWNDNKGVSLLMVNSERGRFLFDSLKPFIMYKESDMIKSIQPQLRAPVNVSLTLLDSAERVFEKKGYIGLARKYGDERISVLIKGLFRIVLKMLRIR